MFGWLNPRNWYNRAPQTQIKDTEKWKDFFDEAEASRRHTPDLPELERYPWQWYFSCDETQTGHHQEILLKGCVKSDYVGFTQEKFMMLNHDLGIFSHPLVFKDTFTYQNPPKLLPIKGELYKVPAQRFVELDKLKMNTVSSFRQQIPIVIPYSGLWIKDKTPVEKVLPKQFQRKTTNGEGVEVIRDGGPILPNSILPRRGVHRVYAWAFFADKNFWEDLLNLNAGFPPVQTFTNPEGLITEYYRYTDAEYHSNRPPRE